jgi:hypothetical protein
MEPHHRPAAGSEGVTADCEKRRLNLDPYRTAVTTGSVVGTEARRKPGPTLIAGTLAGGLSAHAGINPLSKLHVVRAGPGYTPNKFRPNKATNTHTRAVGQKERRRRGMCRYTTTPTKGATHTACSQSQRTNSITTTAARTYSKPTAVGRENSDGPTRSPPATGGDVKSI